MISFVEGLHSKQIDLSRGDFKMSSFSKTNWQLDCLYSGVHRRSTDAGGAEHSFGRRTRAGDPADCAVNFRSERDFPGPGWNGGGTGI